jgi:hypothetical protein
MPFSLAVLAVLLVLVDFLVLEGGMGMGKREVLFYFIKGYITKK